MRLVTARWVLPISAPPIENGCIAVDNDGALAWVGSASAAPRGELLELGDAILLPGLVNAHTHLDLTHLRGAVDTGDFFTWIRSLVDLKATSSDADTLFRSSCAGVEEGIRSGITTFADTSDNDAPMRAMKKLGVRGIAYQEVFGPAPDQCAGAVAEFRAHLSRLRRHESDLVTLGVSPHAPYTVSDDLYREVARISLEERLPVAVHIAESAAESDYVVRAAGAFAEMLRSRGVDVRPRADSSIDLLEATGVLARKPLLIHAVRLSEGDLRLIRERGASIVHCPVSNAKLGHGIAPVTRFIDDRIATGMGTDSMVSNNRMDLLEEARIAMLLQNARWGRADAVTAARMVEMLTLGGAEALGLASRVGSLEAGKRADVAAFSIPRGVLDPHDALLHTVRGTDAIFAMVDGRVLLQDDGAGALHRSARATYHPLDVHE